jgi:hypothetical protein
MPLQERPTTKEKEGDSAEIRAPDKVGTQYLGFGGERTVPTAG